MLSKFKNILIIFVVLRKRKYFCTDLVKLYLSMINSNSVRVQGKIKDTCMISDW